MISFSQITQTFHKPLQLKKSTEKKKVLRGQQSHPCLAAPVCCRIRHETTPSIILLSNIGAERQREAKAAEKERKKKSGNVEQPPVNARKRLRRPIAPSRRSEGTKVARAIKGKMGYGMKKQGQWHYPLSLSRNTGTRNPWWWREMAKYDELRWMQTDGKEGSSKFKCS